MALATLTIDINARLANIEQDLGRVAHLSEQSANRMKDSFDKAGASLKTFAGILGMSLSGGALVSFVNSSIEAMAALHDMSQATGASVESLSGMKGAAKLAGVSIDEVAGSLSKFAVVLGDARLKGGEKAKLLKAVGIDAASVTDTGQALFELSKKLAEMPDQVKAIAIARELLGKNASMPFLRELADLDRLVPKVSTEMAAMADKFSDDMVKLKSSSGGLGVMLASSVLPQMVEILDFSQEITKEWGKLAGILFGIGGGAVLKSLGVELDPVKRTAEDAAAAFKKLDAARKELAQAEGAAKLKDAEIIPGLMDFRMSRVKSKTDAVKQAEKELRAAIDAQNAAVKKAADNAPDAKKKPFDVSDGLLDPKVGAAESFLSGLRNQLNSAKGDISEYSKVLEAITSGAAKEFSSTTKEQALALARQIDTLREHTKLLENQEKVLQKVDAAQRAADDSARGFGVSQEQRLEGIRAQMEALGKTPEAIAKINAAAEIEKQFDAARSAIEKSLGAIGDIEGIDKAVGELRALADVAKGEASDALDKLAARQKELNASFMEGAQRGLTEYLRQIDDVASSTDRAFQSAFKGMEDSLVEFVKTGKMSFSNLADSIISDLLRIAVQQSITKPLAQALMGEGGLLASAGSWFSSNFGGGRASGGPVNNGEYYVVGENGPEILVPGSSGTIIPNHALGGGGSSPVVVNVVEAPGKGGTTATRNDGNVKIIDVFVEQVKGALIGDVATGGNFASAMESQYALNRSAHAWR